MFAKGNHGVQAGLRQQARFTTIGGEKMSGGQRLRCSEASSQFCDSSGLVSARIMTDK
jgi:hypothetical protein